MDGEDYNGRGKRKALNILTARGIHNLQERRVYMKNKRLFFATYLVILLCVLSACGCKHEWIEATCQAPKTCALCGKTEGEIGAHQWIEANCTEPKTCAVCNETEGDVLPHKWMPATCTEPKTCTVCGAIEGEALGHEWEAATCTTPRICSVCKTTEGNPLEHTVGDYNVIEEPTCTGTGLGEGLCSVCENTVKVDIPALGHTLGDWKVDKEATYFEAGEREKKCTVCNKTIENESFELTEEEKVLWYKKNCESFSYKDIARTPDDYKGKLIKITGEVAYTVHESTKKGDPSIYYVWTKSDYGVYIEDPCFVYVDNYDKPRIIQGDIITFYGEIDGLHDEYGEKQPRINSVYYDLKN